MKTTKKLGWLVCEKTNRDGCDISPSVHQFWLRRDAESCARDLIAEHAGDDCYSVSVRRETAADAERYDNYVDAG